MKILSNRVLSDREEVDALLWQDHERASSDQEWEAVLDEMHFEGPADYQDAAQIILNLRGSEREELGERTDVRPRRPSSSEPIEDPEHWRRSCEALFASFAKQAADARLILGLTDPLPLAKLHDFLEEIAAHERTEGDSDHLNYLDKLGNPKRLMLWRGYSVKEYLDLAKSGQLVRLPGPLSADQPSAATTGPMLVSDWLAARANRLCRVADTASDLSKKTGCSNAEATVFLLCGIVAQLPWLRGTVLGYQSARRHSFVIEVGSPHVSAEDVRRFYIQLREIAEQPRGDNDRPHRARRAWTYEMFDFVDDRRRRSWAWQDIYDEWNEQHPEHRYHSVGGMRRSFYEAQKKAQKGGFFRSNTEVYEPRRPR